MQKPTASPPTMQYIAKKRKECKAKGIEAATSLLPGAPSERGNPRFVLWDTPGAKVAALGEVSIDDGAPHGAVAQAWVPSICPCVDTSGNDAYSAVADKYQPSAGGPVFYGTSFTCSKPTIVDVPLNYIQVMMNSLVPQRGPSFCCCKPTSACCGGETDDHSSCGKCCTGCLVNITKCALATQCAAAPPAAASLLPPRQQPRRGRRLLLPQVLRAARRRVLRDARGGAGGAAGAASGHTAPPPAGPRTRDAAPRSGLGAPARPCRARGADGRLVV